MENKRIIVYCFIVFFFILPLYGRVTTIAGYSKPSSENKENLKPYPPVKYNNAEEIERALLKVKEEDIQTHRSLQKLRIKNFDLFVKKLEEWSFNMSQDRINHERHRLKKLKKTLVSQLRIDCLNYKKETDETKKDELLQIIKNHIEQLFICGTDQEKLEIARLKKETALKETLLIQKEKQHNYHKKKILYRYLPQKVELFND